MQLRKRFKHKYCDIERLLNEFEAGSCFQAQYLQENIAEFQKASEQISEQRTGSTSCIFYAYSMQLCMLIRPESFPLRFKSAEIYDAYPTLKQEHTGCSSAQGKGLTTNHSLERSTPKQS